MISRSLFIHLFASCVLYAFYDFRLSNLYLLFQNNMVQLLETILVEGTNKVPEAVQPSSVNSLLELPVVVSNAGGIEFDDRVKCNLQGISFSFSSTLFG